MSLTASPIYALSYHLSIYIGDYYSSHEVSAIAITYRYMHEWRLKGAILKRSEERQSTYFMIAHTVIPSTLSLSCNS